MSKPTFSFWGYFTVAGHTEEEANDFLQEELKKISFDYVIEEVIKE